MNDAEVRYNNRKSLITHHHHPRNASTMPPRKGKGKANESEGGPVS